ncbi:hypothetical protein KY305_17465 [Bacillus sp. YC2]|uniref:hypothetical protein n=1 Tax=Bacillus sp. YC2 TaxID=2861287 RepID=UPI001CA7ACE7|nr:hypothetical protein [Bacillus sp. YC2]MBY8914522.1 hypothetical protein [Bacillus sp. YC2]
MNQFTTDLVQALDYGESKEAVYIAVGSRRRFPKKYLAIRLLLTNLPLSGMIAVIVSLLFLDKNSAHKKRADTKSTQLFKELFC